MKQKRIWALIASAGSLLAPAASSAAPARAVKSHASKPRASKPKAAKPQTALLARRYQLGEDVGYHMIASNRDRQGTSYYEADADGVVKKDDSGKFYEEFSWSNLKIAGSLIDLPDAIVNFRQRLTMNTLEMNAIPDLSNIHPMLIGPVADLLTFYVDIALAEKSHNLQHPGDHFYLKHGAPASWADGAHYTLAEDSVDFDVTLMNVSRADDSATIVVRHVPPAHPQIRLPAAWMTVPVSDTPNNWVEVSKTPTGQYYAEVGKETFAAEIKLDLTSGRMISATLDNPVEISARTCSDPGLTQYGDAARFVVMRHVEINSR